MKVIIFSRVFVIVVKTTPLAIVWCIPGLHRSFFWKFLYLSMTRKLLPCVIRMQ